MLVWERVMHGMLVSCTMWPEVYKYRRADGPERGHSSINSVRIDPTS